MKNIFALAMLCCMIITSCKKMDDYSFEKQKIPDPLMGFTKFHIGQGQQYADNNLPLKVSYEELKFQVYFDQTAKYKTTDPANQDDINKLYGFSDNNSLHHLFSARIGWRWSMDSLRLFGYIYNNGQRAYREITSIPLNKVIDCSIKAEAGQYIFTVNKISVSMPRAATTAMATGYKLYPYFGGDELAPHEIFIWIKE